MSPNRPATKGFLKQHTDRNGITYIIGAEDVSDVYHPYRGPVAQITWDDTWLNITTDKYEGRAMMNIEALPFLRRALAKIAKAQKVK